MPEDPRKRIAIPQAAGNPGGLHLFPDIGKNLILISRLSQSNADIIDCLPNN